MNMATLDQLTQKAAARGRKVCAWRPFPTPTGMGDRWIHDTGAKVKDYELNLGIDHISHSHRIVISKDGSVAGLPKSPDQPNLLIQKLHPEHLACSPKMQAILACLLGETWTEPRIAHLYITSDGGVLGENEGDCGANAFIGHVSDFGRNIGEIADLVNLTKDERIRLAVLSLHAISNGCPEFSMLGTLGLE